jgi:hypothetical protein
MLIWEPTERARPASTVSYVLAQLAVYALDVRRPMSEDQATDVCITHHMAFARILGGEATAENFVEVATALNLAIVLADWGIGQEYVPLINAALAGTARAMERGTRSGKFGFDGPAIKAVQDALDIFAEQLKLATKLEMKAAIAEVHRRVDAGIVYQEAA